MQTFLDLGLFRKSSRMFVFSLATLLFCGMSFGPVHVYLVCYYSDLKRQSEWIWGQEVLNPAI